MENSAATHERYLTKITFGELRASGVRDVLIYCRDHRCSYHVEANADSWADDVRLSISGQRLARRGWAPADAQGSRSCTRAIH